MRFGYAFQGLSEVLMCPQRVFDMAFKGLIIPSEGRTLKVSKGLGQPWSIEPSRALSFYPKYGDTGIRPSRHKPSDPHVICRISVS